MVLVGTKYCIFAGDADLNGGVGASDLVRVRAKIGLTGYLVEDIDLGGGIGAGDLVRVRGNVGQVSQVP
jgi:hypothetical protein